MNIGSPDLSLKPKSGECLEIPRQELYSFRGVKKNGMRLLWDKSSELLRQAETKGAGFVLRRREDISGSGSVQGFVQGVWESEEGEAAVAGRQSLLHEPVCLLRRAEMPQHDS